MGHAKKHIVIVAGEASGDLHAAHLAKELKSLDPSLTFSGLGGPKMKEAGVHIYEDMTKLAVVGFYEVLKHYREIRRLFNLVIKKIKEERCDAVVLVDYPGFNLRLAKVLKKLGKKVIYYISPQVWAWKENRIQIAKKHIDSMLVLFQFEKELYERHGVNVHFVGHPLVDIIKPHTSKEEYLKNIGVDDFKLTIGIMPGSREKEVERHLPIMAKAAQIIHKNFPMSQFIVLKASTVSPHLFDPILENVEPKFKIVDDMLYDALNACDVTMVASGTATLENAILGKPMVIVYKTSFLTWILAKFLIKIPYIGLVNVVAGKQIVPECVQYDAKAEIIAKELEEIFTNEIRISNIKAELRKVKESLGAEGASLKAAQEIYSAIID